MAAAGSRAGRGREGRRDRGGGGGGAGEKLARVEGWGPRRLWAAAASRRPCPRRFPGVPPLRFLIQFSPPFVPLCPPAPPLKFPRNGELSFHSPAGHPSCGQVPSRQKA